MRIRKIIPLILLIFILGSITACGNLSDNATQNEEETTQPVIPTIKNVEDLERGHYYIETKDGYAEPYWSVVSFEPSTQNAKNSNVVWFNDDTWERLPTLYKGQHIIYRTNEEFNETFHFTKYIDEGWSVGICNLYSSDMGHYKFNASTKNTNINPISDSAKFSDWESVVTIEGIDGEKLRADRISPCGTIMGLEKDKEYNAELYVGTEIQPGTLKADSRTMYGSQSHAVNDFEYVQSEIIEISIPSYFNSGYYDVNGVGMFRYVNSDSYDENTDFNEYNPENAAAAEQYANLQHYQTNVTEQIEFLKKGKYIITFTYDDNINEELLPEGRNANNAFSPSVYLNTGEDEITYLKNKGNNVMEAVYTIKEPGMYPLEINNIYGRGYEYEYTEYIESQ